MGRGRVTSPSLLLSLVQRLPEDSLTVALASGGRHLMGWTQALDQGANIFDAINLNTRATGMWDGKPPKLPEAYRPTRPKSTAGETSAPKREASVKDVFNWLTTQQGKGGRK